MYVQVYILKSVCYLLCTFLKGGFIYWLHSVDQLEEIYNALFILFVLGYLKLQHFHV